MESGPMAPIRTGFGQNPTDSASRIGYIFIGYTGESAGFFDMLSKHHLAASTYLRKNHGSHLR